MMSFAEWADALDTRALEAIEADRPVQARKLIEVAEAFERRQLQIDARDFSEPDPRVADWANKLNAIQSEARQLMCSSYEPYRTIGKKFLDLAAGNES